MNNCKVLPLITTTTIKARLGYLVFFLKNSLVRLRSHVKVIRTGQRRRGAESSAVIEALSGCRAKRVQTIFPNHPLIISASYLSDSLWTFIICHRLLLRGLFCLLQMPLEPCPLVLQRSNAREQAVGR